MVVQVLYFMLRICTLCLVGGIAMSHVSTALFFMVFQFVLKCRNSEMEYEDEYNIIIKQSNRVSFYCEYLQWVEGTIKFINILTFS